MKKTNLAEAYKALEKKEPKPPTVDKVETAGKTQQANRRDKKSINAFIEPAGIRELKLLALNTGKTQQELYTEAINDLLEKYGMKRVA